MPRVYNKRDKDIPADAVYIGRPSKWGNPFILRREADREKVIEMYRRWLLGNPDLVDAVERELRGKDLVCWCAPEPCHGDVLLEIANGSTRSGR